MAFADIIEKRRSVYALNKDLPVAAEEVEALVRRTVELVPDAFNQRSQRTVLVLGERHDKLWDAIYDAFGGKVAREKIDLFKSAAGTVLYFTDEETVASTAQKQPRYAENFDLWSQHAMGMLQFAVWSGLAELGIGANLQHYNPVIDAAVRELFDIPESWRLIAQMPFGGIAAPPADKAGEDVNDRFKVIR